MTSQQRAMILPISTPPVRQPFALHRARAVLGACLLTALVSTLAACGRDLSPSASDPAPPPAAVSLPTASRLPLGVRYHTKDMFGIAGAGPGAVGYYREADKRYRVVALLRPDADQAKDLLATFARQPGAEREKAPNDGLVRLVIQPSGDLPAEWVLGRARGVVLGVGDEVRVLQGTMTSADRSRVRLWTLEKMRKVKVMLAALAER